MSVRLPAGSQTSTLSSTSFDDISSDDSKFELSNTGLPSPVQDLEHQGQTYGQQYLSTAEIQHQALRDPPDHQTHLLLESFRPIVPPRRCRMNMAVVVDLEALLPDGILDFSTSGPKLGKFWTPTQKEGLQTLATSAPTFPSSASLWTI